MEYIETEIKDLYEIQPRVFSDDRGYFLETYSKLKETKSKLKYNWVQDNESFSTKGVLRGLHYQTGDHAQAKLVRVIHGSVQDVVVDLRIDSPTYGQHYSIVLSGEKKNQLLVPRGFAHGFLVLSDTVIFSYKCDNFYNKDSEGGLIYNDSSLKIDWMLDSAEIILSEKDTILPTLGKNRPVSL